MAGENIDKSKVIEILAKYGDSNDFFVIEDSGDRVVVDISYMYEYLDKEDIRKLLSELKSLGDAWIEIEYKNAFVNCKISDSTDSIDIIDYEDFHAYLIIKKFK